jgi:hypothetical protein
MSVPLSARTGAAMPAVNRPARAMVVSEFIFMMFLLLLVLKFCGAVGDPPLRCDDSFT